MTGCAPAELGLNEKEVVGNVITALTSDQMIAPSYWVDPKSGNDYFLTVQYPEGFVKNFADLSSIPLRGANSPVPTRLDTVSAISHIALRRPKWIITNCAVKWMFMFRRRAKTSAKF